MLAADGATTTKGRGPPVFLNHSVAGSRITSARLGTPARKSAYVQAAVVGRFKSLPSGGLAGKGDGAAAAQDPALVGRFRRDLGRSRYPPVDVRPLDA